MRKRSDRLAGSSVLGRRLWRVGVLALLGAVFALMSGSAAGAAPKDVSEIPAPLQKYMPNSPGWDSSPWMTSATCQGKGGDFSVWVTAVITDTPELLRVFNAQLFGPDAPESGKARNDAILAGYQQLATEFQGQIPAGYCVDDLRRWAGADSTMRPFGFAWGLKNTTIYGCTDTDPGVKESEYRNKWVGAERAPCDGFHVSCEHAGADKKRCEAWNEFSEDYTDRVYNLRAAAIDDHPASQQGDVDTRIKSPGEIASDIAMGWFGDLTMAIVEGAASLLGEAMTFWTTADRSSMLKSPAIKSIQDLLWYVGAVLLVGSVMWQGIMMLYRRKPDPLVNAGMGLLSFIGWSTLGGTAAVLMYEGGLALTEQVLDEAINNFATSMGTAMRGNVVGTVASVAIMFFLAIIMFFLACFQWFLGFFRMGALVLLLALIPTAAAGQINESTKPWLPKVTGWALAIIWYQPVSGVVYAIGFVLIGDGTDIATVLTGMATLGMAVVAMPVMHKFFDWGGRGFAGGGSGGGGAMVAGAAASALGGSFAQYMDRSGPAGRGGGGGGGEPGDGAPPVAGAHLGDEPVGGTDGSSRSGTPGPQAGGVTPAFSGTPQGSPTTPATARASTVAGASGTAGSSAAGAGPAGAAVAAAQVVKDQVSGAMTDGASPAGGDRNG